MLEFMRSKAADRLIGVLVVIVLLVANSSVVAAQRQRQAPVFRSDVSLVRVDVIVTGEGGAFVADLDTDDFRLLEDGVEQPLLQVQLIDAGGRLSAAASEPPLVASGVARDVEGQAEDQPLETMGALIFLIDVSRLGTWARERFGDAWNDLIDAMEPYSGPKAVYVVDYFGRLHEVTALTFDQELLKAAGSSMDDPSMPFSWRFNLPADAPFRFGPSSRAASLEEFVTAGARTLEREGIYGTMAALESLATSLTFRGGRKGLVWVSEGFPTDLDERLADRFDRLFRAANSANTSIYGLDPTLVNERYKRRRSTRVGSRIGPADELERDPWDRRVIAYDALRDSLVWTARNTAGLSYPYTPRVAGALDEVQRDVGTYYLLAYAPTGARDGSYRELEVEVSRSDVKVRTRSGYTAYSDEQLAAIEEAMRRLFPSFVAPGGES